MRAFRATLLFTAVALATAATAAEHRIQSEQRSRALQAVDYENLLGAVQVLPASGDELRLEFTVVAAGRDEAEARALAESVRIETRELAGRLTVKVVYPLDEHRTFVYAQGGGGYQTHTEYMGREVRVVGARRGGADVHVDVVAHLPAGFRARFENKVGAIAARGVDGDLDFDTGSGAIETAETRGRLRGDTGSGAITVRGHQGEVDADTGSGGVEIVDVTGDVTADTGSGHVTLRRVKGGALKADTGSGRIVVEDSTGSLEADTGSGGVQTRGFVAGPRVHVDTGSGGARIEGDLSGAREIVIDTGSGGATLRTSKPLDARLDIETGSGRIEVEHPDMRDVRQDDGEFSATLGAGRGRVVISTGSGGARVELTR